MGTLAGNIICSWQNTKCGSNLRPPGSHTVVLLNVAISNVSKKHTIGWNEHTLKVKLLKKKELTKHNPTKRIIWQCNGMYLLYEIFVWLSELLCVCFYCKLVLHTCYLKLFLTLARGLHGLSKVMKS